MLTFKHDFISLYYIRIYAYRMYYSVVKTVKLQSFVY